MSYTDDDTPDFEGLRAFLMDYCGTAFAAGGGVGAHRPCAH